VIAAHLAAERRERRGRPRIWPARRIIEAILYLDRTGCAWRYLPADFPPWQTVYGYFAAWRDEGTLAGKALYTASGRSAQARMPAHELRQNARVVRIFDLLPSPIRADEV
jgi:hypothetical protein